MLTDLHEDVLDVICEDITYSTSDLARRFKMPFIKMTGVVEDLKAHHFITLDGLVTGDQVARPTGKGLGHNRSQNIPKAVHRAGEALRMEYGG